MIAAIAPARRRLRYLPRPGARLAMRLQQLLSAGDDVAPIIEPIAPSVEGDIHWLRFLVSKREIFIRPDDESCEAGNMETARLIAWMPQAEFLIARLEARFGASFQLSEPVAALEDGLGTVRLLYPHAALRLAADAADLPAQQTLSAMSAAAGAIRTRALLHLATPRLTHDDFDRLRRGACLLLAAKPNARVDASLAIGWRRYARGEFDPASKTFEALTAVRISMDEANMTGSRAESSKDALSEIPVDVHVRLTSARVRFADLAALRPPALLPLEIEGEELEADIHANGRPFAQGRIVSLGDAYGIVIDALYEEER